MNAKEARENAIKINPQTPELEKESRREKAFKEILELIKEKSLSGQYHLLISINQSRKKIIKELKTLGYYTEKVTYIDNTRYGYGRRTYMHDVIKW